MNDRQQTTCTLSGREVHCGLSCITNLSPRADWLASHYIRILLNSRQAPYAYVSAWSISPRFSRWLDTSRNVATLVTRAMLAAHVASALAQPRAPAAAATWASSPRMHLACRVCAPQLPRVHTSPLVTTAKLSRVITFASVLVPYVPNRCRHT